MNNLIEGNEKRCGVSKAPTTLKPEIKVPGQSPAKDFVYIVWFRMGSIWDIDKIYSTKEYAKAAREKLKHTYGQNNLCVREYKVWKQL